MSIIQSMQEKIARFEVPRGFGVAPILVHTGGVEDSVFEKNYFFRILDIEDFMQS